jgi:hypothetical protein
MIARLNIFTNCTAWIRRIALDEKRHCLWLDRAFDGSLTRMQLVVKVKPVISGVQDHMAPSIDGQWGRLAASEPKERQIIHQLRAVADICQDDIE